MIGNAGHPVDGDRRRGAGRKPGPVPASPATRRKPSRTPTRSTGPTSSARRNNQIYTVFRDKVMSDKVGFTYSGTPGKEAAQ